MPEDEKKESISNDVTPVHHDEKGVEIIRREDNVLLAKLGYRSEFKREFSVSLFHDAWSLDTDLEQAHRDRGVLLFHHGRRCICGFDLFFPSIFRLVLFDRKVLGVL
jgi:hypothetical protein